MLRYRCKYTFDICTLKYRIFEVDFNLIINSKEVLQNNSYITSIYSFTFTTISLIKRLNNKIINYNINIRKIRTKWYIHLTLTFQKKTCTPKNSLLYGTTVSNENP